MHSTERVIAYIDGFNLYHALHDLGRPHLKWVDLAALVRSYAAQPHQRVVAVNYFSAFATWLTAAYSRHRQYVEALRSVGVTPIMGRFKEKDRECRSCGATWLTHEEKETDVNIALHMLNAAYRDTFDHAFLLSNDSDLSPVVRMVRAEFPNKRVRILTPPKRVASKELVKAAGGMRCVRTVKESRIRKALLPVSIPRKGASPIQRPTEYDPPA